ncbi:hypothetical protein Dsin_018815 [Dipteronia sinensis]|uniref:Uncharacterized protein n=1 Tax=Dipteronia sinensis TaxID=43782 RepID=A0AAE0A6V9_9ROSI|nr:hypothetical protein Dsin_018815 [Dipteronia sinensis]
MDCPIQLSEHPISTSLVTVLAPPFGLTIGIWMVLFFRNGAPVLSMTQASPFMQRPMKIFRFGAGSNPAVLKRTQTRPEDP